MPSPYDEIEQDLLQWQREIEERQIHYSLYSERHFPSDSAAPPVVRIDTTRTIPSGFTPRSESVWLEQPFPSKKGCGPPAGTIDFTFTSDVWTTSHMGLAVPGLGPCAGSSLGWTTNPWEIGCNQLPCLNVNYCGHSNGSCVCGSKWEWNELIPGAVNWSDVEMVIVNLHGDSVLADGWYIWATAFYENAGAVLDCFWETAICHTLPCTCIFLGNDSIFHTTFTVTLPLVVDPIDPPGCGGPASLEITFHLH